MDSKMVVRSAKPGKSNRTLIGTAKLRKSNRTAVRKAQPGKPDKAVAGTAKQENPGQYQGS